MAALESLESERSIDNVLDGFDLFRYKTIYISYGSFANDRTNQHEYYQSNPPFLKKFGPYLCIAIDPMFDAYDLTDHTTFSFATIPLEEMSDEESIRLSEETKKLSEKDYRSRLFFKKSYSIIKLNEITEKIVRLLTLSTKAPRLFFVNFIKFRRPDDIERWFETNLKIEDYLGPFKNDYYEWGGYMYPHLIIKKNSTKIKTTTEDVDVSSLLSSSKPYRKIGEDQEYHIVLQRIHKDIKQRQFKFKNIVDETQAEKALLQCVIDIEGKSELSKIQYELLLSDPGPDEPEHSTKSASEGGKRSRLKRKKRKFTRRK